MKKLILTLLMTGSVSLFAADAPFSTLTDLGNNLAAGDLFAVTDISDTTQSANGTSKKISATNVGALYLNDTALAAGWNADTTHSATKNALHDYFITFDTDLDGKVDVIDSTTAGFPAFNASGAFVSSRSVGEGAAIDVTNPTGAAGDPTVAFDSTEVEATTWGAGGNASNIWTFNLSGTDPLITFSSGVVNVSTGTLQQGGVDVLTTSGTQSPTNKTFDAAATGNILKFKSLPQFTSPLRVDGTNCTIGTTSTTLGYGLGTFSNSVDEASNWMEFRIIVPQDWDTSVTPTIKITDLLGGADTGTRSYVASYLSVAASASATGSPGTPISVNISADASGASGDVETSAATTLTAWAPTPGNLLILRIARDGDVATFDTSTVNSTVLAVELAYGASQ